MFVGDTCPGVVLLRCVGRVGIPAYSVPYVSTCRLAQTPKHSQVEVRQLRPLFVIVWCDIACTLPCFTVLLCPDLLTLLISIQLDCVG